MLATITNTDIDIVSGALEILKEFSMVEMAEDGTIIMSQAGKMLGSETEWSRKKREYRENKGQSQVNTETNKGQNEDKTRTAEGQSEDKKGQCPIRDRDRDRDRDINNSAQESEINQEIITEPVETPTAEAKPQKQEAAIIEFKPKPPARKKRQKQPVHPLYQPIQESFLSKNGGVFTDYGKEGKAINGLIQKAEKRFREDPGGFIQRVIEGFYEMTCSNEKFWKDQPFLPSALNASGIFDRVLKRLQDSEVHEDEFHIIEGMMF